MPFNINEFKSTIDKHGGLARPNLFVVEFTSAGQNPPWANSGFNNRDLRFFCQTVNMPGINVNVFEHRPNHIDTPQSVPFNIGVQQLEAVFMVDDSYNVLSYFHAWMRQIINYNETSASGSAVATPGATGSTDQQFAYEIGYKSDYIQTMTISMFSKSPQQSSPYPNNVVAYDRKYVCRLQGVFPVQIGSTTLEWAANDSYTSLPVSFSYSSFDMIASNGIEYFDVVSTQ